MLQKVQFFRFFFKKYYILSIWYTLINFFLFNYNSLHLHLHFFKLNFIFFKASAFPPLYKYNLLDFSVLFKQPLEQKVLDFKIYKNFTIKRKWKKLVFLSKIISKTLKKKVRKSFLVSKRSFIFNFKNKKIKKNFFKITNVNYFSFLKVFNFLFYRKLYNFKTYTSNFNIYNRIYTSFKLEAFFFKKFYLRPYSSFLFRKYDLLHIESFKSFRGYFNIIKKKKRKNTYYFFDSFKSPLEPMRNARIKNSTISNKKTLRNVSYKVFLKKELKRNYTNKFKNITLSLLLLNYKFCLSFYQSILFIKVGLFWINTTQIFLNKIICDFDIIQLSYFLGLFFFFKKNLLKSFKAQKKIKRKNYIRLVIYKKKWVLKKKNKFKFCRWMFFTSSLLSQNLLFDFFTSTFFFLPLKTKQFSNLPYNSISISSVQKLYCWKFRAT